MPIIYPLASFLMFCIFMSALLLDVKLSKWQTERIQKIQEAKLLAEKKKKPLELDWWKDFPNLIK